MTEIIKPGDDLMALMPQDMNFVVATDEDVAAITRPGDFLPRIQINGSSSDFAKEGQVPIGTHVLVSTKEEYTDLGKEVEFLAISFRPKALRIPTDGSAPLSYFKRGTKLFEDVAKIALLPGKNGCMTGPEFLVWLPNPGVFATYFCGNKTMRRAASALVTIMDKGKDQNGRSMYKPAAARSTIKFIKNAKNSWHGADFTPLSTPLGAPPEDFTETLMEEVKKFNNPPESQVEAVEPAAAGTAERAR